MGKGKIERTVFSWLTCRVGMLPPVAANILGIHPGSRPSYCDSRGKVLPEDLVSQKSTPIKIGKKIYVLKVQEFGSKRRIPKAILQKNSLSDVDALSVKQKMPRTERISTNLKTEQKLVVNDTKKSFNVKDSPDYESSPPVLTSEGLDLNSILKHPLHNKQSVKPNLPLDYADTDTHVGEKRLATYPFYVATVREVLSYTNSPVSSRNIANWNEDYLKKLGKEGFHDLQEDLQQQGVDFQNMIMEYLKNRDATLSIVSPVMEAYWESVRSVLNDIKNPRCFQKRAVHPQLRYSGIVDCIATYKSKPVLIEWKKTTTKKIDLNNAINDSARVMASAGAVNFDPNWPYQVNNYLLVYAYSDGSPADAHFFSAKDAQAHWKMWLRRLEQFWKIYDTTYVKKEPLKNKLDAAGVSEINHENLLNQGTSDGESSLQFKYGTFSKTESTGIYCGSPQEKLANVKLNAAPVDVVDTEKSTISESTMEADSKVFSKLVNLNTNTAAVDLAEKDESIIPESTSKAHSEQKNVFVGEKLSNSSVSKPKGKWGILKSLWDMWKS